MSLFSPWLFGSSAQDHERIFVERLSRVMQWARQIAGPDAALAEDLAQDAFLHFTVGRPALEEISNIDKYLYVVLKNLFRSHLAAVSRRSAFAFDPLAHESAMQTWRSVDHERRLTLRDELHRICAFVCQRAQTSKGASAFLLRFFHGLAVADVGAVMRTSRAAVDERLSVVRKEVRRHLERRTPVLIRSASGETDLIAELQSVIGDSCQGECFSYEEARRSYAGDAAELSRDRLAHLASCSKCLALVAELLELGGNSGVPPAAANDAGRLSRWKLKRTELLSTEPAELRLIVNGHQLATERVHRPDNDFSVSVALHEPLDFVEIWNGDATRLLFLPTICEPPEGKYDQQTSVALNSGTLGLSLRFQVPWPTLWVSYTARSEEFQAEAAEHSRARSMAKLPIEVPFQNGVTDALRFPWQFSLPKLSTAIAVALIGALLFVQTRETSLSASELLDRAGRWEKSVTSPSTPVLHRRFRLVRRQKGSPEQDTFVEVWRRPGLGEKVSRWSDASGRVLSEARVASSGAAHVEPDNVWQFEPSADTFTVAARSLDDARVSNEADRVQIQTRFAELVLDRATNRPIEEKLMLDAGNYVFTEALTETTPLSGSPLFARAVESRPVEKRVRPAGEPPLPELPPVPRDSSEERELQVRRELQTLDLATSASVTAHDGAIEVQIAPTSSEQEQALRAAMERIPGVTLSLLSAQAAVSHAVTASPPAGASPMTAKLDEPLARRWLTVMMESELEAMAEEERRLQSARRMVSLAAEWRLLAERYPAGVEARLNAAAESILHAMVSALRQRMQQEAHGEQQAIRELAHSLAAPPAPPINTKCENWQALATQAADLAWDNEQVIEEFYGPAPRHAATLNDAGFLSKMRSIADALAVDSSPSCGN